MARSENQKLKIVYVLDYLMKNGSPRHGFTMEQLLSYLELHNISAERRSIYDDFATLDDYGVVVKKKRRGSSVYYYTENRKFQLSELKLLVDAVQASKFISAAKSNALIKKLESFAGDEDGAQLQRQVFVFDRVKSSQEDSMDYVDVIHESIRNNHRISFVYCQWDVHRKLVPRKDGQRYEVSPWALIWDNENYYLAGYEEQTGILKHYRVDKMQDVVETKLPRQGQESYADFDVAAYTKKNFGMFGGEEQSVKLCCDNSLAGVIIDRFGENVMIIPQRDGTFHVTVSVFLSHQFYGWLVALGKGIKVIAPEKVVEELKEIGNQIVKQYQ